MTNFYDILEVIKKALLSEPFTSTVTYGNITEVDLNKTTIFPLAHMNVTSIEYNTNTFRFNINILLMDIVDQSNEPEQNNLVGNDNTHDILNTQLTNAGRLLSQLKRGYLAKNGYELQDGAFIEPFDERFENHLAGVSLDFSVDIALNIPIC